MKINYNDLKFLFFFIPIYFLKLLNITAENKLLIGVSLVCFIFTVFGFAMKKAEMRTLCMLAVLLSFTALLVIVCGKQGAFFSAVMILALYDIENKQQIYKISLLVGTVGVLLSCYLERTGAETIRYIGGEWTTIFKRSNILYISYVAVVCYWLFLKKNLKIIELAALALLSYVMYKYSGSRTGLLTISILIILLFLFKFKIIQRNRILRILCIIAPAIGMLISYITAAYYGRTNIIYTLDNMMQGRLRQGSIFLNNYNLRLLGQRIFESTADDNYQVLDCAYLDMLICYGVIFAVGWIIYSCAVVKYLYDRERYTEVAVMIMYAVYGISETFLPNGFLNTSMFLYAEYFYYFTEGTIKSKKGKLKYENEDNSNVLATVS